MLSAASVSLAAAVIDVTRRRLVEISDTLWMLRREVDGLVAATRWESDAARGFRADADGLAADIATIAADLQLLCDELGSAVRAGSGLG